MHVQDKLFGVSTIYESVNWLINHTDFYEVNIVYVRRHLVKYASDQLIQHVINNEYTRRCVTPSMDWNVNVGEPVLKRKDF